jgi:hypothetical protein
MELSAPAREMAVLSMLVMISALDDLDPLVFSLPPLNAIYQAVLSGNSAGPPAREIAFEGLWLAKSAKRCAPQVLDDFIQAIMQHCVNTRPMQVVVPPVIAEMNVQILRERFGWHQVGCFQLTCLGLTNTAE